MRTPAPMALVLGARVLPDGRASPALKRRARHAAALVRRGEAGAIIASGAALHGPLSEARLIHDICVAEGVAPDRITLEETARTTTENIRAARPMIAPGTPVVLVTDRFHARRAALVARRLGLTARMSCPPAGRLSGLRRTRRGLREAAALVWSYCTLFR